MRTEFLLVLVLIVGFVEISSAKPDIFDTLHETSSKTTIESSIGNFSTVCWVETTTISEDVNGQPLRGFKEYSVLLKTPAELSPIENQSENSEEYLVTDEITHESKFLTFVLESQVNGLITKRNRTLKCGSGDELTKTLRQSPGNSKVLEIKVSPRNVQAPLLDFRKIRPHSWAPYNGGGQRSFRGEPFSWFNPAGRASGSRRRELSYPNLLGNSGFNSGGRFFGGQGAKQFPYPERHGKFMLNGQNPNPFKKSVRIRPNSRPFGGQEGEGTYGGQDVKELPAPEIPEKDTRRKFFDTSNGKKRLFSSPEIPGAGQSFGGQRHQFPGEGITFGGQEVKELPAPEIPQDETRGNFFDTSPERQGNGKNARPLEKSVRIRPKSGLGAGRSFGGQEGEGRQEVKESDVPAPEIPEEETRGKLFDTSKDKKRQLSSPEAPDAGNVEAETPVLLLPGIQGKHNLPERKPIDPLEEAKNTTSTTNTEENLATTTESNEQTDHPSTFVEGSTSREVPTTNSPPITELEGTSSVTESPATNNKQEASPEKEFGSSSFEPQEDPMRSEGSNNRYEEQQYYPQSPEDFDSNYYQSYIPQKEQQQPDSSNWENVGDWSPESIDIPNPKIEPVPPYNPRDQDELFRPIGRNYPRNRNELFGRSFYGPAVQKIKNGFAKFKDMLLGNQGSKATTKHQQPQVQDSPRKLQENSRVQEEVLPQVEEDCEAEANKVKLIMKMKLENGEEVILNPLEFDSSQIQHSAKNQLIGPVFQKVKEQLLKNRKRCQEKKKNKLKSAQRAFEVRPWWMDRNVVERNYAERPSYGRIKVEPNGQVGLYSNRPMSIDYNPQPESYAFPYDRY